MGPSIWSRSGVTGTVSLGASYLLAVSLALGSSRVLFASLFRVTVVVPANFDPASPVTSALLKILKAEQHTIGLRKRRRSDLPLARLWVDVGLWGFFSSLGFDLAS